MRDSAEDTPTGTRTLAESLARLAALFEARVAQTAAQADRILEGLKRT